MAKLFSSATSQHEDATCPRRCQHFTDLALWSNSLTDFSVFLVNILQISRFMQSFKTRIGAVQSSAPVILMVTPSIRGQVGKREKASVGPDRFRSGPLRHLTSPLPP
jgi:hypothetical protein